MTNRKTKSYLVMMFLLCLAIEISLLFSLVAKHALRMDTAVSLIKDVIKVYFVPLGVVLGGIFGERNGSPRKASKITSVVAVAVSGIWNLLFLVPTLIYFLSAQDTTHTFRSILDLAPYANALVAVALVWAFGSGKGLMDISKQAS